MAELTGAVHHINLSVSDLDRSAAWYQALFDLTEVVRTSDDSTGMTKVILRHRSGLHVGITHHAQNNDAPFDATLCGVDHVALAVAGLDALRSWSGRLDELGVPHSPIKTTPLGSLITLRDPDNIQLELYAAG